MDLNNIMNEANLIKLPCIDCITLPMCKAFINNYKQSSDNITSHRDVIILVYKKCSLLKDYVLEGDLYEGMPFENIHLLSIAINYIIYGKLFC